MDYVSHRTQHDKQPDPRREGGTLRHVALIVAFASIWLALPLLSVQAAPIGGTLTGKVVMKTAGASLPTTPLTVTLLYFNPGLFRVTDEAADARTTTTAPDGSFSFAGLDNSAAGVYRVIVQYKGVAYEPAEQDVTDPLERHDEVARRALREQCDDGDDRGADLRARRQRRTRPPSRSPAIRSS